MATISVQAEATLPEIQRNQNVQESLKAFEVKLTDLRVFDALHTNLPGTAATDDLALIGGTHGTNSPSIKSSDAAGTTVTQKARFLVQLPVEYDDAQRARLRFHAGMESQADATATLDVEVRESDKEKGVSAADLYTSAAANINSTSFADFDFDLTATSLVSGDVLDVMITVAITDAAGSGVIAVIGYIALLCDIRG